MSQVNPDPITTILDEIFLNPKEGIILNRELQINKNSDQEHQVRCQTGNKLHVINVLKYDTHITTHELTPAQQEMSYDDLTKVLKDNVQENNCITQTVEAKGFENQVKKLTAEKVVSTALYRAVTDPRQKDQALDFLKNPTTEVTKFISQDQALEIFPTPTETFNIKLDISIAGEKIQIEEMYTEKGLQVIKDQIKENITATQVISPRDLEKDPNQKSLADKLREISEYHEDYVKYLETLATKVPLKNEAKKEFDQFDQEGNKETDDHKGWAKAAREAVKALESPEKKEKPSGMEIA